MKESSIDSKSQLVFYTMRNSQTEYQPTQSRYFKLRRQCIMDYCIST